MVGVGEGVHVMERRMFESDVRRHFIGRVVAVGDGAMRVDGHTYVLDSNADLFERMDDRRTRILPLADARLVINVLAPEVDLLAVHYRRNSANDLIVSDGNALSMRINELSSHY